MRIQRIQWAGVVIESANQVLMIDPVYNGPDFSLFGQPREPFYDLGAFKKPDIIAITHLHSDHFDPGSIMDSYGKDVTLLIPKRAEKAVRNFGFTNVIGMEIGDSLSFEGMEIHAVFAVDGLGDDQVSWVIQTETKTLLHGGDTLWHGNWGKLKKQFGAFDVLFLPINGAIVKEAGMITSNLPICMNPEQALEAARISEAKMLIPIHYGAFHNPPQYIETADPIERLTAKEQKFTISILKNGEGIEL
jgi:L-ascorbate metabolism protein UlaG (beta-lactamase superfamily)